MALPFLTSTLTVLKNLKDNAKEMVESPPPSVKSRCKLILLSGTVCGIEFCYAAETAFVSPILLTAGVPMVLSTIIWCLSPLLGFFIVPLLGSLSDNCKSIIGRRRPFILLLSCGIILGLILVPYGAYLGEYEEQRIESLTNMTLAANDSLFMADMTANDSFLNASVLPMNSSYCLSPFCTSPSTIALLVIGIVLLDFCCDACQSPCRAYLLDVTSSSEHAAGLTTFTIMAGIGGSVGYVLGGIDWSASYGTDQLSSMTHIRIIFTVALVMYVILTVVSLSSYSEVATTKESSGCCSWLPACLRYLFTRKYERFENETDTQNKHARSSPDSADVDHEGRIQSGHRQTGHSDDDTSVTTDSSDTGEGIVMPSNKPIEYGAITRDGSPDDPIEMSSVAGVDDSGLPIEADLKTYLKSIVRMPKTLVILCITNLLCWMSLVCYSLYFTNYVGVTVYGGDPDAREGTTLRKLYNQGVRYGSLSMALYSITCSIYSMAVEHLVNRFGARSVYVCSQLLYTVGSTVMAITGNWIVMLIFSATAGVMYATLFTMPYILIAHYHSKNKFDNEAAGKDKSTVRGLGTDIAVVSSMVFVAQFLLSLIIGSIIDAVKNPMAVIVAAAILSFGGSISASQVYYGSL